LKNNQSPEFVDKLVQNFYTNLTTQINKLEHYSINVLNLGQVELSPRKIKAARDYAIKDGKIDKAELLQKLLLKANERIQQRIKKKQDKIQKRKGIKINFKEYIPEQ
jgi:F0F1-type ATP synthase epsilon subunit